MKDLTGGLKKPALLEILEYHIEGYIDNYRKNFGSCAENSATTSSILEFYQQSHLWNTYVGLVRELGVPKKYY